MSQLPSRTHRLLVAPIFRKGFVLLGPEAVIGRGEECHVLLCGEAVSRRHAEITWGQRGHELADLGSTNGTFVNGAPLSAATPLEHGDVIAIGPYELSYVVAEGTRDDIASCFNSRRSETTKTTLEVRDAESLVAGVIRGDLLLGTVQMIELNRRSGQLRVSSGGIAGAVFFRDGVIVAAMFGALAGMPAVREIMSLAQGDFAYREDLPSELGLEDALAIRASVVALELMRELDESSESYGACMGATTAIRRRPESTQGGKRS